MKERNYLRKEERKSKDYYTKGDRRAETVKPKG